MKIPRPKDVKAAAANDATLVVTSADFLLSMVETRWASKNGSGRKIESSQREHRELQKIEQQLTKLQSDTGQDDATRTEIRQLHERVETLRKQMAAHFAAWEKTELARHPQRPYALDYIERIFTEWSEIHGDRRRRRKRVRSGHCGRRSRADDGECNLLRNLSRRLCLHHVA